MVVAFHAGLPVPGGFVGVDVFFVISGFVITAMLHRERIKTGRILFRQFYLNRFKRLTPALALVVAATMVASAAMLPPFGSQPVAAMTGIGAMLLFANFVIVRTTGGYFAPEAETNPLLNTWSLSVEEQFYLVFPVVIALGWYIGHRNSKFRAAPFLIVSVLAVLSSGLALAGSLGWTFRGSETILGFYSPFTRAWEFAAGALLALVLGKGEARLSSRLSSVMGLIGIGMLVASLWLITKATYFPGPWTLLPVTGTLLLLLAGTQNNPVSHTLSTRPMVKIGDWSYSIYLWHWPFIVFAIYLWPYSSYAAVLAAIISLAPALASYYWVEQPIRISVARSRIQLAKIFSAVMIPPLFLAGALGVSAKFYWQPRYESGEIPALFKGDIFVADPWAYFREPYFQCNDENFLYSNLLADYETTGPCAQSVPNANIDIVVVGDSHAAHLFNGLAELLPEENVAYYTISATPPVNDGAEMSRIIEYIALEPSIRTVILSADWDVYAFSETELVEVLITFTNNGKQVFVTDDTPSFPVPTFGCKYGISPLFSVSRCSQKFDDFEASSQGYFPQLDKAVTQVPGVRLLHSAKYFCSKEKCDMTRDGVLMFYDPGHLNHQGSEYLVKNFINDDIEFKKSVMGK
jgi:peptidoglycan/LPS O-acetylase OafA/YrhL